MLRTHTCGELRIGDINKQVTLTGWVQRSRDKGGIIWVDLRDRYGITQLILEDGKSEQALIDQVRQLGREYVILVEGTVSERLSKNDKLATGDIEIWAKKITVLNSSKNPPFTIEDNTDGGDELRMKYRYLDLRRNTVRESIQLRHKMAQQTRAYLDSLNFIEVETPVLIKSTPEGARDFVVPSRIHNGEFYALPQSPQTFKQLLMVSGFDRYYQIVKCFRDEDLRADRQPEFTQIDCEMAFITQEDVLSTFEGLIVHLFKTVKGIDIPRLPHMSYADAMKYYGSDKPDTRFEMKFVEIDDIAKGKGFQVFDGAELVVGICAKGCAGYTRKQIDELTEFVKRPQIGAKGLVYARCEENGSFKSSVDKFYDSAALAEWAKKFNAAAGDLLLIMSGEGDKTRKALGELRLHVAGQLGLRDKTRFSALWVLDFPLLEWNEEANRYTAMHHPFTSPKREDLSLLDSDPGKVRANAYDMVINGTEVGGGSIRIHDRPTQQLMFTKLGFSDEEAKKQFGFLMEAFEYGAPPHGGIAFGFDRLCSLFGGADSIRDFIAFPKNNAGKDVMIDTPSTISEEQLKELGIKLR
ncbi:MAG TPA: aspartate--tRNA ligase [Cyclobacteriaceae bacterium]|nr:aspartate--tRNA ligase [Cyclobacteriaceae bacterium]